MGRSNRVKSIRPRNSNRKCIETCLLEAGGSKRGVGKARNHIKPSLWNMFSVAESKAVRVCGRSKRGLWIFMQWRKAWRSREAVAVNLASVFFFNAWLHGPVSRGISGILRRWVPRSRTARCQAIYFLRTSKVTHARPWRDGCRREAASIPA